MEDNGPRYFAYMLRLWRDDEHSPWRATIEDPHTGHSAGFSSLEQLFEFIAGTTDGATGAGKPGPE
jgi:hypothetical protein